MSPRSDEPPGSLSSSGERPTTTPTRPFRLARAEGLANGRTIYTDDGQWHVYEVESGPYDRRSGFSLIFESDGVLRRVRDYPPEWRELSDAELMAVSWRR